MTNLPHNSRMVRDDHLEKIFLKILSLFGLSFFGIIEINLKKTYFALFHPRIIFAEYKYHKVN